jgi:hypothetical protein
MKTLRNTMPPSQTRTAADERDRAFGLSQASASQASDSFQGRVIKVGPAKVPSRPIAIRH